MQIRLPETYGDVKEVLNNSLKSMTFLKGLYGTLKVNPCTISHIQIHDKKDESVGTVVMDITYKERVINKYGKFEEKKVVQTLDLLTTKGDKVWYFNLVVKIWEGKYPTTIAVDKQRGIVYIVNIKHDFFELIEFATLSEDEVDAITQDLNDVQPYKIKLDEQIMFEYIAEQEGLKRLKENIYIEFDCGVRFRVYSNLNEE